MTESGSRMRPQDAFIVALDALQASADVPREERGGYNLASVYVERVLADLTHQDLLDVAVTLVLLTREHKYSLRNPDTVELLRALMLWNYS